MRKIVIFFSIIVALATCTAFAKKDVPGVYGESKFLTSSNEDERYITFTLHSGTMGYFESGDSSGDVTIESEQFKGDAFFERREPKSRDDRYMFVGWTYNAESFQEEDAKVFPDLTNTGMIQEVELYPVWTNKCVVYYTVNENIAYLQIGSNVGISVPDYYGIGENFVSYEPEVFNAYYLFDGWIDATGSEYTEDTTISKRVTEVFARWKYNAEEFDEMELNEEYFIDFGGVFKFTPSDTYMYKIACSDNSTPDTIVSIRILDDYGNELKSTTGVASEDGYYDLGMVLESGTTYFIDMHEMQGAYTTYNAIITKSESVNVTFHANNGDKAYFDDDPTKTEITIPIMKGEEISRYNCNNLCLQNYKLTVFTGWSIDPDAIGRDSSIVVSGDIDVYATYQEKNGLLKLDPNGGYFSYGYDENDGCYYLPYDINTLFDTPIDPRIDDPHLRFAGWSVNKNATVPDEDILDLLTRIIDIETEESNTIYAVYTERVMETFDATLGYMMDNPDIKYYYSTKGVGHIFYGMRLMSENLTLSPIGWEDQDGERIPYVIESYPFYHIKGDTTYKAVWGFRILLDANGGIFDREQGRGALADFIMESDEIFSTEEREEEIGKLYWAESGDKELIGWSVNPDATEPEIIPGKTTATEIVSLLEGVSRRYIYGVWKDKEPMQGDLNGSGKYEIEDIRMLIQEYVHHTGSDEWTPEQLKIRDLNNDGIVGIEDIRILIQKYVEQ